MGSLGNKTETSKTFSRGLMQTQKILRGVGLTLFQLTVSSEPASMDPPSVWLKLDPKRREGTSLGR